MRNRSFAALGTLALLTAASAFGQQKLIADIPFEFSIANKVMPAGHYDVARVAGQLLVRCYSARANVFAPTNNLGGGPDENTPSRLIFNKYGDKYFLAEVWWPPDSGYGAGLVRSRDEREIARDTSQAARIAIPVRTGVVTLARLR
jgi:hypothetical protein